jgi:hypothetical protein
MVQSTAEAPVTIGLFALGAEMIEKERPLFV